MSDPQQEYADARAAYNAALARLREAKRHIPQSPRDRFRQRQREKREAERAHYLANKAEIDAETNRLMIGMTAQSLAIFRQYVDAHLGSSETAAAEGKFPRIGETIRFRLPVSYRINDGPPIGNDDE